MLFVKTPKIVKRIFPKLIWEVPTVAKEVYLTFDDGPTPEITEWVLQQLALYNAKATFFCIGKNIDAEPDVFLKILAAGHTVGNHTHNHVNGWKVPAKPYLENTLKAEESILRRYPGFSNKKLFRPPYGKFTNRLVNGLLEYHYKIVAWDIITEDYDSRLQPEEVFNNVLKYVSPGSIIVFHDSVKAYNNLKVVLPKVLRFLNEQGYCFKAL